MSKLLNRIKALLSEGIRRIKKSHKHHVYGDKSCGVNLVFWEETSHHFIFVFDVNGIIEKYMTDDRHVKDTIIEQCEHNSDFHAWIIAKGYCEEV